MILLTREAWLIVRLDLDADHGVHGELDEQLVGKLDD